MRTQRKAQDEPAVDEAVPQDLADALRYTFKNSTLLFQALTHSSLRDNGIPTNERLEFLGDAVLGLVVSEYLFRNFDAFDEGELTRIKSVVVSARILAEMARDLSLDHHLRVGKGLLKKPLPDSILADAFEAVIAALHLDGGIRVSRRFVMANVLPHIQTVLAEEHERNYKSLLQNLSQKHFKTTPTYVVVSEEGPDHGKTFEVEARVGRRRYPPGKGRNKKEAEQKAASNALTLLREKLSKSARRQGD